MLNVFSSAELYVIRWVGTRGALLFILGFIWLFIGYGYLTNPIERFSKPGPGGALDFLDEGPGVYIFSSLWVIGGAVAIVTAFIRPKTCQDDIGFNGVGLPPLVWGLGYWWSWIIHMLFDGEVGRASAYIGGFLHITINILIVFLSHHLPDHPEGPCARRRASDLG